MTSVEDLKNTSKTSEFIEAYDFEVYNILEAMDLVVNLRPLMMLSVVIYLAGIYFGQRWMKNRPAFQLQKPLFLWNLGLSIFSIIVTIRGLPELVFYLRQPDGFYLAVCSGTPHNYATSFWAYLCLFSKIVEFGDTAFIVLRKQKLIFLHWFHHIATLIISWIVFENYDTIGRFYVMNIFVHSLMYPYYALRALKYRIPQKLAMTITTIQILQMLTFLSANGYSHYKMNQGFPCSRYAPTIYAVYFVAGSFAVLFMNFFVRVYFLRENKMKTQ